MKRGRFVVLSPASLSVELANRQLERATTHSWGWLGACPKLSLGWENTSLFFLSILVFSFLMKSLGQRDKGQWNEIKSEWQFGLYAFFFPFY